MKKYLAGITVSGVIAYAIIAMVDTKYQITAGLSYKLLGPPQNLIPV